VEPADRRLDWPLVAVWTVIVTAAAFAPAPLSAQRVGWSFDDSDQSDLVYIHARVNYALGPDWVREWERRLASHSSVRTTVGSVTNKQFLTDVRLRVNEQLGGGPIRFRYDVRWLDGEHVDTGRLQQFLGFEATLAGPLGLQALVHPTSRKDDMDMAFGVVLTDGARERYLRASIRLDDFLYGDKNAMGGESVSEPVGVQWQGRYAAGRWELYSEGWYSSDSERAFPDSTRSPVLAGTGGRLNGSESRVRWLIAETAFLELQLSHYDFVDGEVWRDADGGFQYANEIFETVARFVFPLGERWRAWPAVHILSRSAVAEGREDYQVDRSDVMPAAFVQYAFTPTNAVELGYMGSWSDRSRVGADPAGDYDTRAWADKAKLAWTHNFSAMAHLQMSVSQKISSGRFGGGNVQFWAYF